jgi:basic amino acid/polyamine antiporter, APA family
MTAPSQSFSEQLLRRRPVAGAPIAHGASDHLKRSIGTFQLTLFGVGATVGTGIFFVLSAAVPEAGPAVLISFVLAAVAAGLSAICYAEMASSVPSRGRPTRTPIRRWASSSRWASRPVCSSNTVCPSPRSRSDGADI